MGDIQDAVLLIKKKIDRLYREKYRVPRDNYKFVDRYVRDTIAPRNILRKAVMQFSGAQ